MYTVSELLEGALEELRERIDYEDGELVYPGDVIHEIADSHVPVYHSDLLELAVDNMSLGTDEPELGPAFDGRPTAVNIIAANVYEHLSSELHEYYHELEQEEV